MSAAVSRLDSAPWRTVTMLCVLYAFSSVDRLILSLLVVPIKFEFALSDTQIGVLFGLAFALLYTLAGLPIARLVDRGNRKRVVVVGVAFWSACTALSAFAQSYSQLLLCRAGVAIGEAVLYPAAISMIADLFPRDERGKPTGLFAATGTVVGLGAGLVGGTVLVLATWLAPFTGDVAPWRLTLALVGIPGVAIALIFAMIVPEPPRRDGGEGAVSEASGHLGRHWQFYFLLFAAVGLSVVISYAMIGWTPTLLTRRFGMSPSEAGYIFGITGVTCGLIGTLGTPWLAQRVAERHGGDGILPVGIAIAVLAIPGVIIAMFAPTLPMMILGLGITLMTMPGLPMLPALVAQQVTPARQRGQMMAMYLLIANVLGLGCGPPLAGLMSDTIFRENGGMAASLALLGTVALSGCALLLWLATTPFAQVRLADEAKD